MVDGDDLMAMVNRCTEDLFGLCREELLGQPVETLIPARRRDRYCANRANQLATRHVMPVGSSPGEPKPDGAHGGHVRPAL